MQIELKGVKKSFGRQHVLSGIDLHVASGETVAVLGRSGTGKSVLLRLLVGLEKPDAGSIRIDGQEITDLATAALNEIRIKIGYLFQDAALYDSMTIQENVEFPLKRHTNLSAQDREKKVHELLGDVGMDKDLQKLPGQLSGGMRKRVGLARALALDPQMIMFDEPTSGLDPISSDEIDDLIDGLKAKRKITSIVVTHDIASAEKISDHVVVLDQGQIVEEGTFSELRKSKHPMVRRFLRLSEVKDA